MNTRALFPQKTKIVATYGPALSAPGMLRRAVEAGVNVFRYNFSHGSPEGFAALRDEVRMAERETGRTVGTLADLQGPKIRIGRLENREPVLLSAGAAFTLLRESVEGNASRASVSYAFEPDEFPAGMRILLDDGRIILAVEETTRDTLVCRVEKGGLLREHKGVNFPGIATRLPALTEKDRRDAAAARDLGADFIALSFVRSAQDMRDLRALVTREDGGPFLVAKIEKPQAVERLDEILEASDGVMVARGDLGVEADIERIGVLQKRIIQRCAARGVPVITATQMLESMTEEPMPTRAEATDVANAVLDGTDAVMLSEESAMGKYPLEAIGTLAGIAARTEEYQDGLRCACWEAPESAARGEVLYSVAHAAVTAAHDLEAKGILVHTLSGRTAAVVSRFRPRPPVVAMSPDPAACRRMALLYGVFPWPIERFGNTDELMAFTERKISERFRAEPGFRFVVVTGQFQAVGATNSIRVVMPRP